MMNYRLSLFQLSGIRESQKSARIDNRSENDWPQTNCEDARVFRSWLVYDLESEPSRRLNWGTVFGLALSVGVSVSFWTAAGLLFARLST
jgi:hypothetical protein